MSNFVVVDRKRLEELQLTLLRLRDYIQDLENCMKLLEISCDCSGFRTLDFFDFITSVVMNNFPIEDCQEFKKQAEDAHQFIRELLNE